MTTVLAVVAGGAGALARYEVAGLVQRRTDSTFPWGTTAVNLLGAAALGVLSGLTAGGTLGDDWLRVLGSGFLGAFTTFSTWMVESVELGRAGGRSGVQHLAVNLVGMTLAGVAAAGFAYGLAQGI